MIKNKLKKEFKNNLDLNLNFLFINCFNKKRLKQESNITLKTEWKWNMKLSQKKCKFQSKKYGLIIMLLKPKLTIFQPLLSNKLLNSSPTKNNTPLLNTFHKKKPTLPPNIK